MNALIGLETGIIPDENFVIKWDGRQYENPAWNHDQTLKTAMQDSVVWYYQELARRVGMQKMQKYLIAANYGNKDISGQIDSFWLLGGIKISDDEQVTFLKKLYQGDLPFSKRSMNIVKKILVLDKTDAYRLSGKTGAGHMGSVNLGRFVGYLEVNNNVYFFATHIESTEPDANGVKAQEITRKILQSFGLLP
jgi:beta-lactamase class D